MTLSESLRELAHLTATLNQDELICQQDKRLKDGERTQFWRRMCYRSFFATVEGACHCMKRVALKASNRFAPEEFDETEIKKLEGKYRLGWGENVKFSINAFTRGFGRPIDLNLGEDSDWEAFHRANKKRDKLTHPSRIDDIKVSDNELDDLITSSRWFQQKVDELKDIGLDQIGLQF